MTSPQLPPNAYTDAPQQHPNLILGSLQLLFWLVFRPSALLNHLKRIDPILDTDSTLIILLRQGRWRNLALRRLLIQGYFTLSIMANLLLGLVLWMSGEPIANIAFRMALSVLIGVAVGVVLNVAAFGVALSLVFSLAFSLAFGTVFGLVVGVVLGVGMTINSWRTFLCFPFLTVWNYLLYRLDKIRNGKSPCLLRYHSAFWDEWQRLDLRGLDKHLLLIIENNPVEGQAALKYLSISPQSWAVQAVQIELDVRSLESCKNMKDIRQVNDNLIFGESLTSKFLDDALNHITIHNQRLALRLFVDHLHEYLPNFGEKYDFRFRSIAKSWREIILDYVEELAKVTELRQVIDSPYIIGVPVTEEQKIFMGRNDIGTRIEQLLRDRRRPPLLLYGQRRMGKTSLLNNIGKLLPSNIIPMFVDLQGAPSSASDHAGFLYNLAREMEKSAKKQGVTLPSLAREVLKSDPFTSFYEWLDKVEQALEQNTALLALDEFEVLDNAIAKGRFDEQDVLGMLRHLIQHRPRFKILLAGSHTIEEYQRWASYLINVQVVHISYLKEAEARQLIERPVKDFTLRYEPNAVERVLQLTRCHPFLVQLLCAEIIVLKNEQDPYIRRLATLADVEAAIPEALQSGGFFFADIQNNQVDATGQAILRFIAAQGEGATVSRQTLLQQFPDANVTFSLLLQRELIEEVDDGYGFQVELIRRWFV
ncbi:nSTAND1 domain-containing NTPase [Nostoc sp.]|uniref:nSTAND1 domain-containing NTPase n=1 Tax=Nostoc sp. TaxID=1180 RepID=UPI002FF77926